VEKEMAENSHVFVLPGRITPDPAMVKNPGIRAIRYEAPKKKRIKGLSNLNRTNELINREGPPSELEKGYWEAREAARSPVFRRDNWPLFLERYPMPEKISVESVIVVLNMVVQMEGFSFCGPGEDHFHIALVEYLNRNPQSIFEILQRIIPKTPSLLYQPFSDPFNMAAKPTRVEEDERWFLRCLLGDRARCGEVFIGWNQHLSIVPGPQNGDDIDGEYKNCRCRVGLRLYRKGRWCVAWERFIDGIFESATRLVVQPLFYPPHMSIAIGFSCKSQHWIRQVAKAVIMFEEYIDQAHAFLNTVSNDPSKQKEAPTGFFSKINKKCSPQKAVNMREFMEQYWNENLSMSVRWNQTFSKLTRRQCLKHIDSLHSVHDIVCALNPRKKPGRPGVHPDYKFDFTGLISLGGYTNSEPDMADVHNQIVVRQCVLTHTDRDLDWIQRMKKLLERATKVTNAEFIHWSEPRRVDYSTLKIFGLDLCDEMIMARDKRPANWPAHDYNEGAELPTVDEVFPKEIDYSHDLHICRTGKQEKPQCCKIVKEVVVNAVADFVGIQREVV
jgi:hypothetical protein